MTLTSIAATRIVNPPGAKPLTVEQIWAAMAYKARNPERFVKAIKTCEVLKDEGNKLTRHATLVNGGEMVEEVSLYEPTSVYFETDKGQRILNIISYNEQGELLLTYSFANGIPGGDLENDPLRANQMVGGIVEHSIQIAREMVEEGLI